MKHYDIMILGGRVAGCAAAIELSRKGHKVLLVDRNTAPTDVISTHFINPRGMTYLKDLGVIPKVQNVTPFFKYFDVQVDGIELGGSIQREVLERRMKKVHPEKVFEVEENYACIRRPLLDGSLRELAKEQGVELQLGTTLTKVVSYSNEGAVLRLEREGSPFKVKARFVVAADGKNSKIAELLQIPQEEERFQCTFACYSYFEGLNLPNAIMKKKNRLTFAAVPTSFGKTMVLVFGPKDFYADFKTQKERNFFTAINEIDPVFYKELKNKSARVEPFRATVDQKAFIRKGPPFPFALIGDASSFKDQCTANGITSALRDAFLVSDELDRALKGKKKPTSALIDYHSRHYLDLLHFFEFTGTQAESNPLRPEEARLYRAISKNQNERDRFLSLYFDSEEVKSFFKARRIEMLTESEPASPVSEIQLAEQYRNPFTNKKPELHLEQTCFDYGPVSGFDILKRTQAYFDFYKRRELTGTFQYSRTLHRFPGTTTRLSDEMGRMIDGVNFASQDYLGLGQDPEIYEAALEALKTFGPHSAGSPMIIGNTLISKKLEEEIQILTGKKYVLLYPTGYAAGMGSILGVIKPEDHIVMDRLSHACLQQGARAATRKIHKYAHLDSEAARAHLEEIRKKDTRNAILLITEGLFSMDADSPDLKRLQEIAH